jgi:hypothetical protein
MQTFLVLTCLMSLALQCMNQCIPILHPTLVPALPLHVRQGHHLALRRKAMVAHTMNHSTKHMARLM